MPDPEISAVHAPSKFHISACDRHIIVLSGSGACLIPEYNRYPYVDIFEPKNVFTISGRLSLWIGNIFSYVFRSSGIIYYSEIWRRIGSCPTSCSYSRRNHSIPAFSGLPEFCLILKPGEELGTVSKFEIM